MKILGLFFLFFLFCTATAIMMDLMMGMKLSMSLRNMRTPFWVMTVPEYVILVGLLSSMFIPPIISFFKKRKQSQPREKS